MEVLITVETEMLGEDFAAWLKKQISPLANSGFSFSKIVQEDYGWGFWAWHSKDPFWVAVSYVGDGPQLSPAQWVISVNYALGFNLIKRLFQKPDRQALEELRGNLLHALTSNTAIRRVPTPRYDPNDLVATDPKKESSNRQ